MRKTRIARNPRSLEQVKFGEAGSQHAADMEFALLSPVMMLIHHPGLRSVTIRQGHKIGDADVTWFDITVCVSQDAPRRYAWEAARVLDVETGASAPTLPGLARGPLEDPIQAFKLASALCLMALTSEPAKGVAIA